MDRRLTMLWLTTILPFATLPWVSIAQPQPRPWYFSHALFHMVYAPLVVVAIVVAYRIASSTPKRPLRVFAWLLVGVESLALAGHLGELVSVVRNGGFDAGEEIFENSLHKLSAAVTVPALMVGLVLVVTMTVMLAVDRRRQQRAPQGLAGTS